MLVGVWVGRWVGGGRADHTLKVNLMERVFCSRPMIANKVELGTVIDNSFPERKVVQTE